MPPNFLHRLGDAFARATARLKFALDALSGRMPLPTPLERSLLMSILSRLAALEAAQSAQAPINATIADAAAAAQQATTDVGSLTDRVTAIMAEIGTESAPAEPVVEPVDPNA